MRNILFLAVLTVLFLTSSTWGADISGIWTITQQNNEGAPSMAQGGAPEESGGAPGATVGTVSKEWTAVKK